MESVTARVLQAFFQRLGEQLIAPATLYLLGGSAMCLLGSPRETLDVDFTFENPPPEAEAILGILAAELELDLDLVPLGEFIPLPPEAEQRRRFVGHYGFVDVYIFDLYSIALSKIARGFESDFEDVEFLLLKKLIGWETLEAYYQNILPLAQSSDIDPQEFQQYFETLRKRVKR
jgi:hypothetical protein